LAADDIVTRVSHKQHRQPARHPDPADGSIRPAIASCDRENSRQSVKVFEAATLPDEALYTPSVNGPSIIESRLVATASSCVSLI